MAPVVEAYQAMRGIAFLAAVTFVVEIGDVRRFETAPQLMAYLGLVPSESSTGERVKRGGVTKAGNKRARRVLIEGAWAYRFPARVAPPSKDDWSCCRNRCERSLGRGRSGYALAIES
jgi:Transposase and inactivated derivatives